MARILPLGEVGERDTVRAGIEAIFFDNATTEHFASEEEQAAYLELWLGRYLRECPEECFVALDDYGAVAGYLAGSLFSDRAPLAGPDYYTRFPPALVDIYPAHLHVNVRADCRGKGIGAELVRAFLDHCRASSLRGVHAVTTASSRSAAFFETCGLIPMADRIWRNRELVLLGRDLIA